MADLYDFAYGDYSEDTDFYLNLARATGGPILELGAGTGRVAFPLAKAGHRVVGIDTSSSMLAKANEKVKASRLARGRLSFIEADMTAFDLDERFALVIVAANTFQHLTLTRDQRACIGRVAAHLQPGGAFTRSVRSPASLP